MYKVGNQTYKLSLKVQRFKTKLLKLFNKLTIHDAERQFIIVH